MDCTRLQSRKQCVSASGQRAHSVRRKVYTVSVLAITVAIWGHIIFTCTICCHETSRIYTKKHAGSPGGSWAIDSRPAGRNESHANKPVETCPWQKYRQCLSAVFHNWHGHHQHSN